MSNNFWVGFEKVGAVPPRVVGGLVGGVYGAIAGGSIGEIAGIVKGQRIGKEFMSELRKSENKTKTRDEFEGVKHLLPKDSVLLTRTELNKLVMKEHDLGKQQVLQQLRNLSENGNACAIHETMLVRHNQNDLPDAIRGKNVIVADDNTVPSVLFHEAGHLIDFEIQKNKSFIPKFLNNFRSTYAMEEAAWEKAPGKVDEDVKKKALSSYHASHRGLRLGALIGGILGAGVGVGGAHAFLRDKGKTKPLQSRREAILNKAKAWEAKEDLLNKSRRVARTDQRYSSDKGVVDMVYDAKNNHFTKKAAFSFVHKADPSAVDAITHAIHQFTEAIKNTPITHNAGESITKTMSSATEQLQRALKEHVITHKIDEGSLAALKSTVDESLTKLRKIEASKLILPAMILGTGLAVGQGAGQYLAKRLGYEIRGAINSENIKGEKAP